MQPTISHDPEYARQAGYSDAYYDDMCLIELLPCHCDECCNAYEAAQQEAIKDIAKGKPWEDAK